jgi:hypothetical protein
MGGILKGFFNPGGVWLNSKLKDPEGKILCGLKKVFRSFKVF